MTMPAERAAKYLGEQQTLSLRPILKVVTQKELDLLRSALPAQPGVTINVIAQENQPFINVSLGPNISGNDPLRHSFPDKVPAGKTAILILTQDTNLNPFLTRVEELRAAQESAPAED